MDAGPVYTKRPLSLAGRAQDIYAYAGELSFEIVGWMVQAEPIPTLQDGTVVKFVRRKPWQSVLPHSGGLSGLYDRSHTDVGCSDLSPSLSRARRFYIRVFACGTDG